MVYYNMYYSMAYYSILCMKGSGFRVLGFGAFQQSQVCIPGLQVVTTITTISGSAVLADATP